ncbi:DDE-type integrase/transposase/recombinase [Nocardiopsis lucentensis]|uniref:DDE-type integrase/transposase/recombinase n=1 Tax=Nocardiopsis lucentensis TaxID=53441 RepID=UPI001377B0F4
MGRRGYPAEFRRKVLDPVSDDLVDRQFSREGLNQLWVTDITEHPIREGEVYCAAVLDVCSRRVVGWAIDSSPTAALATNALGMAIDDRRPASGTVIHSDYGVLFGSCLHASVQGVRAGALTRGRSGAAMTTPSSPRGRCAAIGVREQTTEHRGLRIRKHGSTEAGTCHSLQ